LYQDIYTGYQEALQAKGMTVNQDHIYTLPAEIDNPGSVLAKDMIAKKNLPRALFIADEGAANNMVAGFKNAGISIPDDLAIIVFGNDINEQYYATELTTIQQPGRGKGKQAVEMVMDMIEHPERINESRQEILKLALKVRTSCGCGN
jgi:DNA-binding LacI/PurR family transcriptional regulator